MTSLRKRQQSRGRVWLVLVIVIVAAVTIIGLSEYGGSLGLSKLTSSTPQDTITLSNVTMSSFPDQDGFAGLGGTANILNNAAVKVENMTISVNGASLGSCVTTTIQPGQQIVCKSGKSLPCTVMPSAPPYSVEATVEFTDGKSYSTSIQITSPLGVSGC